MSISTAHFTVIDEPWLEFGKARAKRDPFGRDPQLGLIEFGPYSLQLGGRWHPRETHLIPVSAESDFDEVASITKSLTEFERVQTPGTYARTDFPGYDAAFRSELKVHCDVDGQRISDSLFSESLKNRSVKDGFNDIVSGLNAAIESTSKKVGIPNAIVVVYLSRDIVTQFRRLTPSFKAITPKKKRQPKNTGSSQLLLFDELNEPEEQETSEESLYHDLRRALKTRAMQSGTPLQILTDSFLTDEPSQPWAGKYWNVSCSLFAKAGGIPWRLPTEENIAHCGIRFGVSTNTSGVKILVGVAQVFARAVNSLPCVLGKRPRRVSDPVRRATFLRKDKRVSSFQMPSRTTNA